MFCRAKYTENEMPQSINLEKILGKMNQFLGSLLTSPLPPNVRNYEVILDPPKLGHH